MKKPWFRVKKYGWGWGLPATWQGWMVLVLYVVYIVWAFGRADSHSHSVSDMLLNFIPYVILGGVVLFIIAVKTSDKPKWRWGDRKP